jgi:hypothetical protein
MTHFTLKHDNDFLLIHIYVDQCYDFFGEIEVNPTSPVSSPCHTLAPGLYGSEIRGL